MPNQLRLAFAAGSMLVMLGAASCDRTPTTTATNDPARRSNSTDTTDATRRSNSTDTKSPMDQSQSSDDIKITADIRRLIMEDKAMSVNAQNCKIITEKSGMVTLRGAVNSQAERDSVEAKAKSVAGVKNVDNQLEIKST